MGPLVPVTDVSSVSAPEARNPSVSDAGRARAVADQIIATAGELMPTVAEVLPERLAHEIEHTWTKRGDGEG
jgi:hypothetical protein